jgi:hypothetical protein
MLRGLRALPEVEPLRDWRPLTWRVARDKRQRLLRDRELLLGALRDYEKGKTPALPELELAALVDGIERRIEDIERRLRAIGDL